MALLLFLYEVSIVVLIDFIAVLLHPGILLIQIVNTNMYLIHFRSKNNIKIHFLKSWSFKVSDPLQTCEINCIDISKDFTTTCWMKIFKQKCN